MMPGDQKGKADAEAESKPPPTLPKEMADKIASLVNEKFRELTNDYKSPYARRKVLAGVVSTRNDDPESAQVRSNSLTHAWNI